MNKLMIATAVALTLAVPQAQAFVFKSPVLSPVVAPSIALGVQTGHIGVLNGSGVNVLSGNTNTNVLSGIGILGSGSAGNVISNTNTLVNSVVRGRH